MSKVLSNGDTVSFVADTRGGYTVRAVTPAGITYLVRRTMSITSARETYDSITTA